MRFSRPSSACPRARFTFRALARMTLLLIAAGCEWHGGEYPTDPGGRHLVVHGMLAGGEQHQEILVEYTRGIGEGYYRGLTPATGAQVVVLGEETHRFREDSARPGIYLATFSPVPGRRYALQIRGPAGEAVTSETLVPEPPRLISPGADTTISLGNSVSVRWSWVPGAAGYVLVDRPPGQPSSFTTLLHPTILRDTSVSMQPGAFGGKSFYIRIATVDANYRRYMQGAAPDSEERSRSAVEGGHGLFGSYALSNPRWIYIR